ncbi:HemK2/MTQ2 family protein methyltransferase [Yinghuangia seranimata]|uniref:HemK2/MTQ2 family protein methyltransferase n=1 Tax=Yinghuangia seranimata TaxID=408067 RepID=UPI00248AFD6E|nr:HemK2/MTQ2 family protein methyltransferase [Yinghuangia seranimata]MDI2125419.1 methyltransferase [Yinghuangia seranimata]
MTLLRFPGMYRPQSDTWLLMAAYLDEGLAGARRVLDVGTGTGAVALAAARAGGADCRVTAIDVSRRAVWAARLNGLRRRNLVRVRRGDLLEPVAEERFDLVLANPPYVPAPAQSAPERGPERSWDAGQDGRLLLDRLCRAVPDVLGPGGTVLVVQSALSGVGRTLRLLRAAGLRARVVARLRRPFGPVLTGRASYLESRSIIEPGCREEELVVVRGDMAA